FKGKIPIWFRGDSTLLDPTSSLKNFIKTRYLKWVYRHVDLAFYVGLNNRNYFKKYGLKEHQLVFAPHAIDNERFAIRQPDQTAQFRARLGIPEREILILFAGKFEPKKNPLLLLQAFTELNAANTHLLFVGNGPLEAELKNKAVQFNQSENQQINKSTNQSHIHFLPFQNQSQMPIIYQAADLFCLPSKGPGETWGLSVNEAMACGKAILVSDKVGCATDLVKPYQNGLIFKSENLPHLIENLKHLTLCKAQLEAYGQKSREIIQDWNFEALIFNIEKHLNHEPQRQN
ncbi:MAG TPA: glycosyltransferase family 4 protein, partial [Flavisolibacter sp.]|nr:glycosyltransferase family 4 protein [Flavisolibacter sp.]